MANLDSYASAFIVLAAVLYAPAVVMPRWGYSTILGGGNLGIWQMYLCSGLPNATGAWTAVRAFSVISLLATLVALAAMVAHVTIVGPKKRKTSLRTFTGAAYISVLSTVVMVIIYARSQTQTKSMLSYSFGLCILGIILMFSAALLGTCKSL